MNSNSKHELSYIEEYNKESLMREGTKQEMTTSRHNVIPISARLIMPDDHFVSPSPSSNDTRTRLPYPGQNELNATPSSWTSPDSLEKIKKTIRIVAETIKIIADAIYAILDLFVDL